jgi:hypothetical protein
LLDKPDVAKSLKELELPGVDEFLRLRGQLVREMSALFWEAGAIFGLGNDVSVAYDEQTLVNVAKSD